MLHLHLLYMYTLLVFCVVSSLSVHLVGILCYVITYCTPCWYFVFCLHLLYILFVFFVVSSLTVYLVGILCCIFTYCTPCWYFCVMSSRFLHLVEVSVGLFDIPNNTKYFIKYFHKLLELLTTYHLDFFGCALYFN